MIRSHNYVATIHMAELWYALDIHTCIIECLCCKKSLWLSYLFKNFWNQLKSVIIFIHFTEEISTFFVIAAEKFFLHISKI